MAATRDTTVELDEYIVTSGGIANKKKHRPINDDTDEPACDSTLREECREWRRKASRQTIFQSHCQNPQCFGGGASRVD